MSDTLSRLFVSERNRERIQVAIDAAQVRCRERTITADRVLAAVHKAERTLGGSGIPQRMWEGATYRQAYWGKPARSYNSAFMGTGFTIERTASAWVLTVVERTYADRPSFDGVTLPAGISDVDLLGWLLAAADVKQATR